MMIHWAPSRWKIQIPNQSWGSLDFWLWKHYFFSLDLYPGPTCNNGFIKLFSSWTKYKPESTNSSLKWWFTRSNFMPTYLKYKYMFFSSFRIKVGSGSKEKNWISSLLKICPYRDEIHWLLEINMEENKQGINKNDTKLHFILLWTVC